MVIQTILWIYTMAFTSEYINKPLITLLLSSIFIRTWTNSWLLLLPRFNTIMKFQKHHNINTELFIVYLYNAVTFIMILHFKSANKRKPEEKYFVKKSKFVKVRPSLASNWFALKRKYHTFRYQDELHKIYSSLFIWHQSSLTSTFEGGKELNFLKGNNHFTQPKRNTEKRGLKLQFLYTHSYMPFFTKKFVHSDAKQSINFPFLLDFLMDNILFSS